MARTKGSTVKLIQPTIQGEVVETRYNNDKEELERLVSWTDGDGEVQTRWFLDSELEDVVV